MGVVHLRGYTLLFALWYTRPPGGGTLEGGTQVVVTGGGTPNPPGDLTRELWYAQ